MFPGLRSRISMILTRFCWPRSNHDSEKRFRTIEGRGRTGRRAGPPCLSRHEVASLTANSSGFEYIRVIREGLVGYETRIRFWSLTMTATKHYPFIYIYILHTSMHLFARAKDVSQNLFSRLPRACFVDELRSCREEADFSIVRKI